MDLHKLQVFVAIARTGSFSRAAEQLFITQPTVSQQLAQLESSLGLRLLERGTRHVRLTDAGEALLPDAEKILSLLDAAAESARAAAGLADKTLRLGVGHTLATYVLPELLRDYRHRHPGTRVKISLGNTAELLAMVESGVVEVALVGTPAARAGIIVLPFMEDRIVAIAPPSQAVKPGEMNAQFLRQQALFVREPGSALYTAVQNILGPSALAGENVVHLDETEAIKRCVAAGLGMALIQEMAVREEVEAGRLQAFRLQGTDDARSYAYACKESNKLSAAARNLIDLLLKGQ